LFPAESLRRPAVLGLISAAAVLALFMVRIYGAYGGSWSAVFTPGDAFATPPPLAASTYVFTNSTGYDGQFYRLMAHDPFNRHGYWAFVDLPGYRAMRILQPALAWGLGLGRREWIDIAFVVQASLWLGLGVWASCCWVRRKGLATAWGLAFLLIPAVVASAERILLDGAATALCAMWALALAAGRWRWAVAAAALAALNRETGALLALAGGVWMLREKRWGAAAAFAAALGPLAAWGFFVTAQAPAAPPTMLIGRPVYGVVERLFHPHALPPFPQLALASDILAWSGFLLTQAFALWMLRRWKEGPWMAAAALLAALSLLVQGHDTTADPLAFARPMGPLAWIVLFDLLARGKRVAALGVIAPSLILGLYLGKPLAAALGFKLAP
jgi:hypothetical protein